jgi:DNA processing protein
MMAPPATTETLPHNHIGTKFPPLSADESLVIGAMDPYPVHIDALARLLSIPSGKLSAILLQLELKGVIKQSPGKFFSLIE